MKPKKLLSFLLATAMTISLLPTFTLTASAANATEKNITLGTSALKGGQKSNVYFGNYQQSSLGNTQPTEGAEGVDWIKNSKGQINSQAAYYKKEPIKWRVLSNADGKAFLLSDKNLDVVRYHEDYESVTWETSTIRSWLNGYGASSNTGGESGKDYINDNFIGSAFLENEKKEIVSTTVEKNTEEDIQDKVFLLSIAEAQNTAYGFTDNTSSTDTRKAVNTAYVYGGGKNGTSGMNGIDVADYWWLRSPGNDATDAAIVGDDGGVPNSGSNVDDYFSAVRPAFNLNPASVLFTSSKGVKVIDEGSIKKNENYVPGIDEKYEYKLTMLDTSRNGFRVDEKTVTGSKGQQITLSYSGAKTGDNEYISAMIVKNGEVLYYGQGEKTDTSTNNDNPKTEKGRVNFTLPNEIENGEYKLYVFNEQINGDKKTDFSSEFQTVTLNVLPKATFTTEPTANTLTYNGTEQALVTVGETSEGTVKYSLSKDGVYTTAIPTGKDLGIYTVWYYIEGDDNHSDSEKESVDVTISQKEITNDNAKITLGDSLTYNGTEQTQTVTKVEVDGLTLTENTDYTISNNTGTEAKTDYVLTITGKGNFIGTATTQFSIAKAGSQTSVTRDNTSITYGDTLTLTAAVEKDSKSKTVAKEPDTVVFYLAGTEDVLGEVTVDYDDDTKKDKGTATLELKVTDDKYKKLKIGDNKITAEYGGSVNLNDSKDDTITVELKQRDVTLNWSGYENLVYDGNAKNVTATTTDFILGDDVSLNITGEDKTNAGTYTATATELTGTYAEYYKLPTATTQEYTINPKPITATIGDIADQTYTGSEIKPTITAYDGNTTIPESEYDVVYSNNKNAGQATVRLNDKANGNYTVSGSTTFEILPKSIDGATVGTFAAMTYIGDEQTPSAEVSIDGLAATGVWSDVKYVSDTTTFTADGNFTGTISDVATNMAKKNIENATLALDAELTYNGQEQTQNVTLTLDGFTNVTFDVSANEQTDVNANGNYTLTVTGTGNFTGTKTLDWNIKPYTPTENPNNKTTARVRRGRTLADATVTNGEMLGVDGVTALEGTFAWGDDTKTMSADGTEQMTFTPTNTNYAPITINVAVSTYSSGGGGTSRYTVKFDTDGGNTITNQTVTRNNKATEPTKPTKEGYIFDGWYTDSKFTTKYDFDTKVTKNVTLYAKWVEDEVQEPSDDKKDDEQKPSENEWKNPFADVASADWFFDNVRYANENGLMSGVTNTTFAPNDNLTRAMLVTVLYRAEGEPAVNYAMPFTDIIDTAYYAEAVRWAASENIVNGVTETEFAPDMNITREQIAAIIYRYAKFKGIAPTGAWAIKLDYADVADISDYAVEGVMYCTMNNIMQGKDNNMFAPKDNATRAETAAILNRFIESNK